MTAQSLDSEDIINTFILAPLPTCLSHFLNHFVSPPPTAPISSGHCCSTSHLHLLPTSFPGTEHRPPGRCPHPIPARFRRLLYTSRLLPAFAVVSCIICLPRCRPWPASRSLSSPGGSPGRSLHIPYVLSPPPCAATLPVIFWV